MEECEGLDSEMTELQELQCEASEDVSQDDEDEVEELHNSLREVVQDQSVKPKLQCLMVDPSFSMVTVQSEDSGIVWETASSRCSTPWASETSSISEASSMDGSGAAGKITIVFDEEKIVRRRTRSGGRSSRLGDRLSRPGSSRSASALGVERLEMAEVSLPNVKQEKAKTEPDLEELKNKDQQLFSLISEGYEILNIRVPSKLPTVDEEESTELQDNLSYLDQTPKIRSRKPHDVTQPQNHVQPEEGETQESSESPLPSADTELRQTPTQKESSGDIDYFEKFTLVDVVSPGDQASEVQEREEQPAVKTHVEEKTPVAEAAADSTTTAAAEDSFVFVTDVEIVGEHLDEVFYGKEDPEDALQRRECDDSEEGAWRRRRESQRSGKESGSVLFGSEETTLTPIFISPGPPKIIDPILLEEPTAMSFMYSDLYEDAVGERRRSDEECSEPESVASEKTYKRRLSDSEEADGYLEKFILKDETPTVDVPTESEEDKSEGRMMWSQSKFEMTGCLTRAVKEEEKDEDKAKTEESTAQEEKSEKKSETLDGKDKIVPETDGRSDRLQLSMLDEMQAVRGESEESVQEPTLEEDREVKNKVKGDQPEPSESVSNESRPRTPQEDSTEKKTEVETEVKEEHHSDVLPETPHIVEVEPLPQTQKEAEEATPVVVAAVEETPVMETVPTVSITETNKGSEAPSEPPRESVCEEEAPDTSRVAADEQTATLTVTEAPAEKKEEPADEGQETLPPTETETSAEPAPQEEKHQAEVVPTVPEDAAPVEVITECDAAVHAVVEVTEKEADAKEILTQVQIDLQEVGGAEVVKREEEPQALLEETVIQSQVPEVSPEETVIQSQVPEVSPEETVIQSQVPEVSPEETVIQSQVPEVSPEETVIQSQVPEVSPEVEEISAVETEISSEAAKPVTPEEAMTKTDNEQLGESSIEHHEEESVPDKTPAVEAVEANVQEKVNVGEEVILLVPKGQAVEMDIEVSEWADLSASEHQTGPETTTIQPETPQAADEKAVIEEQMEIEPEVPLKEEGPVNSELDTWISPPAPVEEANIKEPETDYDLEVDAGVFSPLRSFTGQEDLSDLQKEDEQLEPADVEQNAEIHKLEDASETMVATDETGPQPDVFTEDVVHKLEGATVAAPEVIVEELDYEVISKQDAKELPEPETQRDEEEPKPAPCEEREEKVEIEEEEEEKILDLSPEEEPIEADYDIIDAEEEQLARLAAELQGMDWFCLTCGFLLSEDDWTSGEHGSHDVTSVDKAYEEIKDKLSDWISELQGRSENIEDLVSELELAYNSVEDQCVETEAAMQAQNEEMMALVMEQYNSMSVSMEEEKKAKLEQLYDQIVSFQESIDSAKATLDTTAREAETEARTPEDIHVRLKEALDSATSLELGPRGLLVFEDYAKGNTSSSHLAQRKGIPVPQRPTLQRQEPGSATSTSVTVYWRVNPGDIIDCFQVYCMEDPQGAVSEEYRVTVKESYCVLEELEPDKTYKVWVMAVNYTGCSLPSERLAFRTAPSVPVIDTELCTVMWDSATLRWSSEKQTPEQTYTLEYCRQYELEGEGLRSISGIKSCEQRVLLQPSESYLFYIKAVNEAGASEQSEAALISTKGTRFHLLKASAHPALELSADHTTVHFSQEAADNTAAPQCPSILGELLPPQGRHYWETVVSRSGAYRLGVACSAANRNIPLGENSLSWCLQCIPTPSGCTYQLLHNGVQSSVFVIEMPERVGTLLDHQSGRLSFYNAHSGTLLGSFCQRFTQPCHPALALERPGSLEISTVLDVPEFTTDS